MRHQVKGRKLSRTASHRKATLRNLATSLLKHKKIKTTTAKAKELKVFVEPMITKAKEDTVAARRHIAKDIKDRDVLKELFTEIVEKVGNRPGGYTRVIKLGNRLGDAAEMSIIELVDFSNITPEKKSKKDTSKKAKAKTEEVEEANVIEESTADETVEGEKPKAKAKPKKAEAKPKKEEAEKAEAKPKKAAAKKTEEKEVKAKAKKTKSDDKSETEEK